jgi:hypothetical protein
MELCVRSLIATGDVVFCDSQLKNVINATNSFINP